MMVLQLRGPMAFRVLQWCHPMLASLKEDKLLYPDDHLIWCSKVDPGPRTLAVAGYNPHSRDQSDFSHTELANGYYGNSKEK